jgi:hypothetical protein
MTVADGKIRDRFRERDNVQPFREAALAIDPTRLPGYRVQNVLHGGQIVERDNVDLDLEMLLQMCDGLQQPQTVDSGNVIQQRAGVKVVQRVFAYSSQRSGKLGKDQVLAKVCHFGCAIS